MLGMTWSDVGTRFFETGIDRGVLFPENGDPVPWNGLVSVNKNNSGVEPQSYYLDGVKFLMDHSQEEFSATLEAFTYPKEFDPCLGIQNQDGLEIHEQPRETFGLCYRTLIGNDVEGKTHAYKLNFVYNAIVGTTQVTHNTVTDVEDPSLMSWHISSLPEAFNSSTRSSSYSVDSRDVGELGMLALETYIYGGTGGVGQLPTPSQIRTILMGAQAGYTYHWLGTPRHSQSVQRLGSVEIRRNLATNPSFETKDLSNRIRRPAFTPSTYNVSAGGGSDVVWSNLWGETGPGSLRIGPGANTASATYLYGTWAEKGLEPGKTYTISATIFLPNIMTGAISATARAITIGLDSGGVIDHSWATSVQQMGMVPNRVGTYRVRVVFTVPTYEFDDLSIRLTNGSGMTEVYWDNYILEEGITDGTYFDGDGGADDATYSWIGDANNSHSVRRRGSVVAKRNYFVDPLLTQAQYRYYSLASGDYSVTGITGAIDGPNELISSYARTSVVTPSPSGSGGYNSSASGPLRSPLAGGIDDPVSISGYFRYTGSIPSISYTLRVAFFNGSSSVGQVNVPHTFPNGEWVKIENILAYPTGSYTHVAYWLYFTGGDPAPAGSILDLTGIQIEKGYMSDLIVGSFPPVT